MNNVVIVGRIVRNPEIKQTDNSTSVLNITLAVDRSFKNINGEYEVDFIDCILWKGIAKSTAEYCVKGDLIGVKGRLQTRTYMHGDIKRTASEVVAEKVTFLSYNRNKEKKEE
ncbi:MAG: single-stranded DNA-binding protein [Bacilli bacterium]